MPWSGVSAGSSCSSDCHDSRRSNVDVHARRLPIRSRSNSSVRRHACSRFEACCEAPLGARASVCPSADNKFAIRPLEIWPASGRLRARRTALPGIHPAALFRPRRFRAKARRLSDRHGLPVGQHDGLVPCRQCLGQLRGHAAAVRGQHPHPGRFDDLHRPLRHDDAPIRVRVRVGLVNSEHGDVSELRIPQRLPPNRGARQCVVRAVAVGEPPPAVELPERQVQPALPAEVLQRHQLPRRRQQRPAVGERLLQVPRGVQHVGGDDQVVAVGVEALLHWVVLDVQHPVLDRHLGAPRNGTPLPRRSRPRCRCRCSRSVPRGAPAAPPRSRNPCPPRSPGPGAASGPAGRSAAPAIASASIRFAARATGAFMYRSAAVGSPLLNSSVSGSMRPRSTSGRAFALRRNRPISFEPCAYRAAIRAASSSGSAGMISGQGVAAPDQDRESASFVSSSTPDRASISSNRRNSRSCSAPTSRRRRSSTESTTAPAVRSHPSASRVAIA